MKRILLIPYLQIHNANALSSPYTIGFPAMTAWLGAVHALQRKLNQNNFSPIIFKSVAVVCHEINLQTHKGRGDFVYSIKGTGNPLDKDGKRPSFIEEGRCHLVISLVVEYEGIDADENEEFIEAINLQLHSGLKMASGDILDYKTPTLYKIEDENDVRKLTRKLMPGYAIIERRELMAKAMSPKEEGGEDQDAIEAMLDYLSIKHRSHLDDNGNVQWTSSRKANGWIVPIATGFHGLTKLGSAKNQRDSNTPHRFAESVVTLGEFLMPYRIKKLDDILWHYHVDLENNLYLCQQNNQIK